MNKPVIAFDESGNTGQNLLSSDQPIFVLASVYFDKDEADSLCNFLKGSQGEEAHFTRLKKSKSGRQRILEFLNYDTISSEKVIISVYHKRYMIVTKIVDLLIESMMHTPGYDLYKDGENIALSNLYYNVLPVFCGKNLFESFLLSFINMVRTKKQAQISDFYEVTLKLKNNCSDEGFKEMIDLILWTKYIIRDVIPEFDITILDPAIPTFCEHCGFWSYRLGQEFEIIVDESKPLRHAEHKISQMMKLEPEGRNFGRGQRKITFPYKTRGISFVDSKDNPEIQLADIFAGATAHFLPALLEDKPIDEFKQRLRATISDDLISNVVWPGTEVSPSEFHERSFDGSELVDYVSSLTCPQ